MRKLASLIVMLVIVATSIGCGQAGLSEEEIRSIVREEVTKQIDSIDELTVSELVIKNQDGEDVVVITEIANTGNGMIGINDRHGEGRVLLSTDYNGHGQLIIVNRNDEVIASLEAGEGGFGTLCLGDKDKKRGAYLYDSREGGQLSLQDNYGNIAALLGMYSGQGVLLLRDEYGRITFGAP